MKALPKLLRARRIVRTTPPLTGKIPLNSITIGARLELRPHSR
jgi:hypothetical protein